MAQFRKTRHARSPPSVVALLSWEAGRQVDHVREPFRSLMTRYRAGKTSIVRRCTGDDFTSLYHPTIVSEDKEVDIVVNNETYKCVMVDIAGLVRLQFLLLELLTYKVL